MNAIKTKSVIKYGIYRKYIKRPMDFILSLMAIVFLIPVFIVAGILVRTKLGSPILFKQKRPGLNEKIFTMYKFRTMTDERDGNGELLQDSVRLTKFGRLLRSTSLDELPELFNILKGDMSIVGPRPLLVEYLSYYTDIEKQRHIVRPGLTGLAQINGRNFLPWDERLRKDVEYTMDIRFINDLKIISKTAQKVLGRKDISVDSNQEEGNLAEIRNIQKR